MRHEHGLPVIRLFATLAAFVLSQGGGRANLPEVTSPIESRILPAGVTSLDLRDHFGLQEVDAATARIVRVESVLGTFNVLLAPSAAPKTVENFLAYVAANRFENTIIHRSVPGFVIQGGGYSAALPPSNVPEFAPILLEYNLPNIRGSIAMARTSAINSATSEFFINTVDNTVDLGPSNGGGYAVFGQVMGTGMAVVDAIAALPRFNVGSPFNELPLRDFPPNATTITLPNLVTINSIQAASVHPTPAGPSVLAFSAGSSDPFVVGATVVEGAELRLFVPAQASGTAEITVKATDTHANEATSSFQITVEPPLNATSSQLANISTRALVRTGADVLIPGFSIDGSNPKIVLIRAVGPTLGEFNVSGALADPRIVLFRREGETDVELAENDDWGTNPNASEISGTAAQVGAFPLGDGSRDAALLATLDPGAYTVVTSGADDTTGISLVEVYAVGDSEANTRLVNTSARAYVGNGDQVIIPGFTVSGDGTHSYLIRVVGASLGAFGVTGALANPLMVVHQRVAGADVEIARNDDWETGSDPAQIAGISAQVGAFALTEPKDAALLLNLEPGAYSVVASGVGASTGVALVEVYEVKVP